MKTIDMLGKPCPMPVVAASRALQDGESAVTVLVDNAIAVENLRKMADGRGYAFALVQRAKDEFAVTLGGDGQPLAQEQPLPTTASGAPTVLISKDQLGEGDETLGKMLMKGYLFSLTALTPPPKTLLFLNGGVRLVCEGSAALGDLQTLVDGGCAIHACGTCLNYYGLTESLAIGQVADMLFISQSLAQADRLITL